MLTFEPPPDWPQEESEQGSGSTAANGSNTHLWEESWDDDDENEDFSKQLK
jgi:26 proteasome complex subunit DSS1